ncbi:MAG: hypothetical protein H8E47_01705 [Anaerolineales bacterium]|nr:hypothetical protein [Anaerolineales bacterium]
MKRFDARTVNTVGAILLIVVGILLLLQNLGILVGVVALIWSLIFGAGGLIFLYVFLTDRTHYWWAVIPGFALLGLAALIALDEFFPRVGEAVGGMIFLGGIGLAFWVIYFIKREHWWAVIPGGVMFTVALVAGLDAVFEGAETGGVLFLGLGLTFGLLSLLSTPHGRMKWALIPAAVLLVMGLLITAATTGILEYLWAIALILVGLYLLLRMFVSR